MWYICKEGASKKQTFRYEQKKMISNDKKGTVTVTYIRYIKTAK